MDISRLIDPLNEPQRQAVCTDSQHTLVLAGAGSGKTRVLTHRIVYLIETGQASPFGVLAVTFTNKAAKEMRSRIDTLMEQPPRGMWVGTFHSLAHRLLKTHYEEAKLPEQFQVLDSDDQLRMVKRIIKDLNLDDTKWPPKSAQWFINGKKDEGKRFKHIAPSNDFHEQGLLKVYEQYELICQQTGVVDFGELLLRAHELWLNNPKVLEHYQDRFRHILVDEYQDINSIQYAWLRVLCGEKAHLMVVGDDDQSIYGWRGAKVENILRYSEDFKNVETIKLEQNYRSSGHILKAANAVIGNNSGRLGKELWTDDEDGETIRLYAAYNEHDEARFIAEDMEGQLESYNEMAILYRSNAQSRVMEEHLIRLSIPYRIYGGHRFYDRLEIKNAMCYLRMLLNRHDDTAMERIINLPVRGIGNKSIDTMRIFARDQNISFWQAATQIVEHKILPARACNAIESFITLINDIDKKSEELNLTEMTDCVIKQSNLIAHHQKEKGEKGRTRVENLKELVSAAASFNNESDNSDLSEFVSQASLDSGDNQADIHEQAVSLMTLHSAKGLEFDRVYLVGLEEQLFPHKMSMDDPDGLQEERRLCYVGITRARKHLCLSYAESRSLYGSSQFNAQSRFIREIPNEHIQEIRLKSQVTRPVMFKETPKEIMSDSGFQLGQDVNHPVFGKGVILSCEGIGSNARVEVKFAKSTKWLMLQFAKLEAL